LFTIFFLIVAVFTLAAFSLPNYYNDHDYYKDNNYCHEPMINVI
jgi:hypothetical protein